MDISVEIVRMCTIKYIHIWMAAREIKIRLEQMNVPTPASFEHFLSNLKSLSTYPKAMYFHCLFMTIMTTAAVQK